MIARDTGRDGRCAPRVGRRATERIRLCIGIAALLVGLALSIPACTSGAELVLEPVASGLHIPVDLQSLPGDPRLFVVEKVGTIRIIEDGRVLPEPFLDIHDQVSRSNEQGLLGLAFHPDYAHNGLLFVNYTDRNGDTRVVRYHVAPGGRHVDPASRTVILGVDQPYVNHNGGQVIFGPDGMLYIPLGDGGSGGDPHGNGQNLGTLLGKLLRIDVDRRTPYAIPKDNPFVAIPGARPEIWAYGLRNPWRSSFDKLTGDLYIGDVGESCWEEVNYAPASDPGGRNYGWRKMEGNHCFNAFDFSSCDPPGEICAGTPLCNDASITRPIVEFSHGVGCSVTGGYVYRGCRMTNWQGTYLYGDFCAGFVKGFKVVGGVATQDVDLSAQLDPGGSLGASLSSFGQDAQGELYIASISTGSVLKIVPPFADLEVSAPGAGSRFLLSKSGSWTWENLTASTDVPVSFYRVYRGTPGGSYSCVFKALTPAWASGGDPASPAPGQLFAYVVSAVQAGGQESLRGTAGTFNPTTCP